MTIPQRLENLRRKMNESGLHAYIIPSSDPHQSEYVADHWQCRKWISGFTGSAGTVAIMNDEAGLWTDSRYFLQAEMELKDTGITLFKMTNQFEPQYVDYIAQTLPSGSVVGIDGKVWSQQLCSALERKLKNAGMSLRTDVDLVPTIWTDRPPVSTEKIILHDQKLCGKKVSEKLDEIRSAMKSQKVDYHFIPALDDIAWTFNIRGKDVDFNPVVISFGMVGHEKAWLFIDEEKSDPQYKNYFNDNNIEIQPYRNVQTFLNNLPQEKNILVDPNICSAHLYKFISASIIEGVSIPKMLKAIKNNTEIRNIRHAMAKDGAALAYTFFWLERTLGNEDIYEYTVLEKLAYYRSQQELYFGESFGAIIGYKGNGAIIHYAPPKKGSSLIKKEGILLVDSGGQYHDGTTDITRTFTLDSPTENAKKHYTLILKGMISLSKIRFPKGTYGGQLDTLARQFLWENGLNYLHGTGHGVGYFLNVHEPPQGFATIQSERGRTIIEPGMLTSNEPGYYIPDTYGMRIENLIVCNEPDSEGFLSFETLTLYPFDVTLIEQRMLTPVEIKWINDYHDMVYDRVSPLLNENLKVWFREKCCNLAWKE
jgi:Xaa-Pro aminopeptidase